jgi:capsular exopolysaccharide synthesis family protein
MENLQKQIDSVRRWKWLVLFFVVVSTVAAVAIATTSSTNYTAKATVVVGSASGTDQSLSPDQTSVIARGYIDQLNDNSFQSIIAQQAKVPGGVDLQAAPVSSSPFITISATASSPEVAQQAADAFTTAFVAYTRKQYAQLYANGSTGLRQQLQQLSTQIAVTQLKLSNTSLTTAQKADLQGQLASLQLQRSAVSQLLQGSLAQNANPALVGLFATAGEPTKSSANVALTGVLGLLGGLVLGVAVALLLGALELRLRSPIDVRQRLGLPTLGSVVRGRGEGAERARAEDLKALASALAVMQPRAGSIAVTSPGVGEGKTLIASNLARYRAAQGDRVIFIEADVRSEPDLPLNGRRGRGLADLLAGDGAVSLREAVSDTDMPNLKVIAPGAMPTDPYSLFKTDRIREVVAQAREHADLVVVDTPALLQAAEGQVISSGVDGTVLVLDSLGTQTGAAVEAKELLVRGQANILGVVLNRVGARASAF